jgi:hypothetical protein
MPKLILLNGPPRSGKDECAKHLFKLPLTKHRAGMFPHWFRMSQPIKDAVKVMWDMTSEEVALLEKHKEKEQKGFAGKSYRQVQISLSEDWMKQQFGPRIFGELALRRIKKSIAEVFVCSDCGFPEEVVPLFEMFSKDDILLVKLHRPGYTFAGDSRSYIRIPGVREVHVQNDSTLGHLTMQVETLVRAWVNGEAE